MFVPPAKPDEKPAKAAVYVSMVLSAILAVMLPLFLTRPIPTRESLAVFDASDVPFEVTGTDYFMLTIPASPDTQLRHINVQKETVAELRRLLAHDKHRVTVLSTPNHFYFAHLWGGPQNDRTIMELTVDNQVLISYEESVADMEATRWQGVIVIVLSLGYTVWYFVTRVRKHAFAAKSS